MTAHLVPLAVLPLASAGESWSIRLCPSSNATDLRFLDGEGWDGGEGRTEWVVVVVVLLDGVVSLGRSSAGDE